MRYHFKTSGSVCSDSVSFTMENGKIADVQFENGCSGNTQGVARLAEGMEISELVARLKGIRCGAKNTSCPDQLALAVEKALAGEAEQKKEPK